MNLKKFKQGSREFNYLFEVYLKEVKGVLLQCSTIHCKRTYKKNLKQEIQDLIQESCCKFYLKIPTIHEFNSSVETEGDYKNKILGLHLVILKNCHLDNIKKCSKKAKEILFGDLSLQENSELNESNLNTTESELLLSPEQRIMAYALSKLSYREETIIRTYAEYMYDYKEFKCDLPDEIEDSLCKEFKITKGYLRLLKLRVRNKLMEYIEELKN